MPELILTEEQMEILTESQGLVAVKDAKGNVLGRFEPNLTVAQIADLKRVAASLGPWFSGEQIRSRLTALQVEWERNGSFDESYMFDLLKQLETANPGHTHPAGEKG